MSTRTRRPGSKDEVGVAETWFLSELQAGMHGDALRCPRGSWCTLPSPGCALQCVGTSGDLPIPLWGAVAWISACGRTILPLFQGTLSLPRGAHRGDSQQSLSQPPDLPMPPCWTHSPPVFGHKQARWQCRGARVNPPCCPCPLGATNEPHHSVQALPPPAPGGSQA